MTENYTPPFTSTPLAGDPGVPPMTPAGQSGASSAQSGQSSPAVTDVAKSEASDVGQSAVGAGQHVAGVAKDQVANVTAEAGKQAKDLVNQARSELTQQAGQQQQRLAGGLRALGDELQSMVDNGQQSGVATDLAGQAAQKSHEIASWLDEREPGRLVEEVKDFARRRPGAFLLVAASAGLVAGRLTRGIKANAQDQSQSSQQYAGRPMTTVVPDVDVVRPYASSEDLGAGFPNEGRVL
ncbi:hypothetical protein [Jatrophihabitans lederbergiae]|uniref:DUF3618 domain-containing protein n=1 Tax=Jatrophihabitans lederbergiae TaxID=3075547 RepID=A0ABU2JDL3_9ACTN|nr:hypothetical protein [Jatrophihabitans sp. DSM 44399]MDT0262564.1 hypothetical protein [Jatrophihabitans sp. DSM 44399]